MSNRLKFHEELSSIPGIADASTKNGKAVYFQPPASVRLSFPCIIYDFSRMKGLNANNRNYILHKGYTVKIIDPDPDSEIPEFIEKNFPYAMFDRSYVADNLHHFIFTIYY